MRHDWSDLTPDALAIALRLSGRDGPDALTSALVIAALSAWAGRVRSDADPREVKAALTAAAAYTAAAGLADGLEAGDVGALAASVRLGEVMLAPISQREKNQRAETFRQEAERLMTPYVDDGGFAFRGVEG